MTKVLIQCSVLLAAIGFVSPAAAEPEAPEAVAWPEVDALRAPVVALTVSPPWAQSEAPAVELDASTLAKQLELPDDGLIVVLPPRMLSLNSPGEDPRR